MDPHFIDLLRITLGAVLFALLGVRLGWAISVGLSLVASALASTCAFAFVPPCIEGSLPHSACVALLFGAAVQIGFIVGLETRTS